jgi:eukaryotic translation initiation factor 2C
MHFVLLQELKLSVTSLLIDFYKKNSKKKPERLIFYRDGVSEGQFAEVQRSEVSQILAACRELGASSGQDYAPTVSSLFLHFKTGCINDTCNVTCNVM